MLAAVVVAVGDLLLRAPLRFLARRGSAALALGLGLLAQVAVLWLALSVVPGIGADNLWSVLGVLVLTAIVMAVGRWVIGSSNSDYVVSDLVRRARRQARREGVRAPSAGEPRPAGMLVVQLDGVAAPVLREAIEAGLAPNIAAVDDAGHPHARGLVGPDPVDDARQPGRAAARRLVARSPRSAGGTGTSAGSS